MKNIRIKTKTNFVCAIMALLLLISGIFAINFVPTSHANEVGASTPAETQVLGATEPALREYLLLYPQYGEQDKTYVFFECSMRVEFPTGHVVNRDDFRYKTVRPVSNINYTNIEPKSADAQGRPTYKLHMGMPNYKIRNNVDNTEVSSTPVIEYNGNQLYGRYACPSVNGVSSAPMREGYKCISVETNLIKINSTYYIDFSNWDTPFYKYIYERTSFPLPADPTKEGYTFAGWYFDSLFTRPYDGSPILADTTLHAKFTINTFTITFNAVEGFIDTTLHSKNVVIDWNTVPTAPIPTREGYNFLGWFDGTTKYENTALKTNKTFTAHWEIKTFTVRFNAVGGMIGDSDFSNLVVNWNTVPTVPTPTRTGYIFKGWFVGAMEYENMAITANTTLTAQWEIMKFTVTFVVDGAEYIVIKDVPYGTNLVEVMEATGLAYFTVSGVATDSGEAIDELVVSEKMTVSMGESSTPQKVLTFIKLNWIYFVVGLSALAVIISILAAVIKKRR